MKLSPISGEEEALPRIRLKSFLGPRGMGQHLIPKENLFLYKE